MEARRARRRELRAELGPLEQDLSTDEMQRVGYLDALREERRGAEARLARARALGPHARERQGFEPEGVEPPSGAQRVAAAEQRLADVDAEIARVESR